MTQHEPAQPRHTVDSITSDALDQLYRKVDTLTAVCRSNKQAYIGAVKDALAADERAKKAEAAIECVRALATNMRDWDGHNPGINRWATDILAALDGPTDQTPA